MNHSLFELTATWTVKSSRFTGDCHIVVAIVGLSMAEECPAMINRRHILFATPALLVPSLARAATRTDLGDASAFRSKAESFLTKLSPEQTAETRFPYGGEVQASWNFMGVGGFIKPGLRLEKMDNTLKDQAWDLLSAVLSPRGIEKAGDVMILQQVLIDQGNSPTARGPERFSFAFFGTPAKDEAWALRFEGHHLTLTFNVDKDRLTGVTPSSFSVNPNRVQGGFKKGLITLKREDDLARKLANDLTGSVAKRAFFTDQPYGNIRATAGNEMPFKKREGVAAADLATPQRTLLAELVDAYTAEHLAPAFSAAIAQRLKSDTDSSAHFAFSGSTRVGERAYYRVHSDHMLIEFAAVDSAAQHLHTIFHLS
jgi:Protein of unknown function (DUF3500)